MSEIMQIPDDDELEAVVYVALASDWYKPEGPRNYERDAYLRRGLAREVTAALRGRYADGQLVAPEGQQMSHASLLRTIMAEGVSEDNAWLARDAAVGWLDDAPLVIAEALLPKLTERIREAAGSAGGTT